MRILQHARGIDAVEGGIQRTVNELASGLSARDGLSCDVLCQGPKSEDLDRGDYHVFRRKTTVSLASAGLSWRDYAAWTGLRAHYDLVHVHCPWPQSNLNELLAPFKGPLVVHWHSDIVRKRWLYSAFKPLERRLLRRADRIVVTSPKLLEESAVLGPYRRKCVVIPIGVRDPGAAADPQTSARVEVMRKGRFLAFALGRLVTFKGFWYLIEAARELPDDYLVVIGGDGPLRKTLQAAIGRHGLRDKVKLVGSLLDPDARAYMDACDVFCLPSVHNSESFGIVQIEAMRARKSVVSTHLTGSGIDWVNQHGVTGLSVPPADARALAAAIVELCDDASLRRKLADNGRARFEALFTAEKMAAGVEAIYRSLL